MRTLSLIIPKELFDTIEAMSIEQDLSISGVIVNLIENALKPIETDVTELINQNRNLQARLSFLEEEFEKILRKSFLEEQKLT
jgi:hypothetical protein